MTDSGTCPWCDQQFEVTSYGRKLKCPNCNKSIDVYPDTKFFLDTDFGVIGVSTLDRSNTSN